MLRRPQLRPSGTGVPGREGVQLEAGVVLVAVRLHHGVVERDEVKSGGRFSFPFKIVVNPCNGREL